MRATSTRVKLAYSSSRLPWKPVCLVNRDTEGSSNKILLTSVNQSDFASTITMTDESAASTALVASDTAPIIAPIHEPGASKPYNTSAQQVFADPSSSAAAGIDRLAMDDSVGAQVDPQLQSSGANTKHQPELQTNGPQSKQHHRRSGRAQHSKQQQQLSKQPPQDQDSVPIFLRSLGTVVEDASSAPQPQDYVFVRGLRLVKPYYFDFKCFVKKRQDGRPLMQLMSEEFPMLGESYYRAAVAGGRLRVEGSAAVAGRAAAVAAAGWAPERPLRAGMCIRHFIHRHEPPVLAGEVQILGVTADFVAVNKPPCLPVHTVGQYRKNTVMGLVQAHHPDLWPLYPTYRLDKPVSGVLLLARSGAAAARMRVLLEERGCHKTYVARVQGVFPDTSSEPGGRLRVDVALGWDAKTNHATPVPAAAVGMGDEGEGGPGGGGGGVGCSAPEPVSSAKPAVTLFRRLSVAPDDRTSVVEATPLTGRTHQIRVHLQYIGHSIANDTQYGGSYGLPLFFRRGMGGPTRPHVNGQRRRHAAGQQQEQGEGQEGEGLPAGGEQGGQLEGQEGERQQEGEQGAEAAGVLVGCSAVAVEGPAAGAGRHKRQRRCGEEGVGCDGSGDEGGSGGEGAGGGGGAGAADPHVRGPGGGGGPNSDAASVAASSQRYMQLYTQPEFQVSEACSDPLCPHCPCLVPEGYPIDLEPLFLHAARYAAGGGKDHNEGGGGDAGDEGAACEASSSHNAEGEGGRRGGREGRRGEHEQQGVGSGSGSGGEVGGSGTGGGGLVDEFWCFEAPLPDWAAPDYVAVPASGAGPSDMATS